jgi:hypothetical protein
MVGGKCQLGYRLNEVNGRRFCEQHAETLAWEVEVRFGERGSS